MNKQIQEELATEYALLKGLSTKNYEQLKRLRQLEKMRTQTTKPKEQELETIIERLVGVSLAPNKTTELARELVDQAIKTERNRIVEIMDSFIIEDEFYGKGLAEIQTELIINAIKKALENNES